MVKGKNYVEAEEKFDKKRLKKEEKSMTTAGMATALKKSSKETDYSKMPKVKGQKKKIKLDLKMGQVI